MPLRRRLRTFTRFERRRQSVLLEAALLFGFAYVATRALPFSWTRRLYGRPRKGPTSVDPPPGDSAADPAVRDVRWALYMVRTRLGADRACLASAIAGRMMLRRRGYAPTLYIGAARSPSGGIQLHAWLVERGHPVAGVGKLGAFETLAAFDAD